MILLFHHIFFFFFFNDTATTEIYTLSLHDALPISSVPGTLERASQGRQMFLPSCLRSRRKSRTAKLPGGSPPRSEEHTSELQSRLHLVCRLLLEKKKTK